MVHTWPSVCLPLGDLMKIPHQGTLQAVLNGLDVLLSQKDAARPSPRPHQPASALVLSPVPKASGLLLPSVGRALGMWQFQARPLTLGHHSPTLRHP